LIGGYVFIVRVELKGDMNFYKNLVKRIGRDKEEYKELSVDVFMRGDVLYVISGMDPLSITLSYTIYRKAIQRGLKACMYVAKEVSEDMIPKTVKEVSSKWLDTRIGWFDKWLLESVRIDL
jgi:hypothetical protein